MNFQSLILIHHSSLSFVFVFHRNHHEIEIEIEMESESAMDYSMTNRNVRSEEKGREGKGREGNKTEQNSTNMIPNLRKGPKAFEFVEYVLFLEL
jgi:hypothetical protein